MSERYHRLRGRYFRKVDPPKTKDIVRIHRILDAIKDGCQTREEVEKVMDDFETGINSRRNGIQVVTSIPIVNSVEPLGPGKPLAAQVYFEPHTKIPPVSLKTKSSTYGSWGVVAYKESEEYEKMRLAGQRIVVVNTNKKRSDKLIIKDFMRELEQYEEVDTLPLSA